MSMDKEQYQTQILIWCLLLRMESIGKPQEGRGNKYNYSREVKILPGMNYKVESVATGNTKEQEYNIEFEDLNPSNNPIEVSGKNSTNQNDTLKLRDGHGIDANVKFTIRSTSPGVEAKFSDDGKKINNKRTVMSLSDLNMMIIQALR